MEGIVTVVLMVILSLALSAGRKRKGDSAPKQAASGRKKAPAQGKPLGPGMEARMRAEFPHLYTQAGEGSGSLTEASMEGVDPCHDDPAAMPSGSLGVGSMEGIDPCHDDPSAQLSGSLGGESLEGMDPCHEDWEPLKPEETVKAEPPQEPSGLRLDWTGEEIVRGFVYGEILKRKIG